MEQTVIDRPAPMIAPPAIAPPRPTARVTISARFLLGIYAIVPLCLVAMVLDKLFGNGNLFRNDLPSSPESYFFFQIIFGTPHIIASAVILVANGEYMRTYWGRLLAFSLFLLVFFGVGSLFIPES